MFEFMNITKALADENRIRILMALNGREELCVCQLIDMLQLAPSTVSKHLFILRNARLVLGRKEGRWMYYRLNKSEATPADNGALTWVIGSVADDPLMKADQTNLAENLPGSPAFKCGP
mgnify:FL=1